MEEIIHNKKIVVLHGWGSNSEKWSNFKNIMEKYGYEVFIRDLPGFGKENKPERPYGLNDYLDWVEKNIFSKIEGNFYLLGHSFGGRLAIKYCGDRGGGRVEKLILVASPIRPFQRPWYINFLVKFFKKMSFIPYFNVLRVIFYTKILRVEDYIKLDGVMKETFKKIISEDISSFLGKIKKPTLIVWGDKDKMVHPKTAFEIHKKIKNSKLVFIKNCAHAPHLTHLEEFSNIINKFISEKDG